MPERVRWKLKDGMTWRRKLEQAHPNHGKCVPVPKAQENRFGAGLMLIPRPLDIDALVRSVRKGRLLTQGRLRARLAEDAGAVACCPLTTGIFLRIVAEAAEESRRAGRKRVTPYWRVIRDDGKLNDKFPGGPAAQARKLKDEGHHILPGKGRQPLRVEHFEDAVVALSSRA